MDGIHPTAVVASGAQIDPTCRIGPYAVIGSRVRMGPSNIVGAHVVIEGATEIGAGNRFLTSCAIGGSPQIAGAADREGRLVIGERNVFHEFVTVHGGLERGTSVGSDGLFMATAHVAHDCDVDDHVVMANGATLGGHVSVQRGAQLSGLCAVHQHVRVGALGFVAGGAMVVQDVPPFCTVQGDRARLTGLNTVGLRRSGSTSEQISRLRCAFRLLFHGEGGLESRLAALEARFDDPQVAQLAAFLRSSARGAITTPRRRLAAA